MNSNIQKFTAIAAAAGAVLVSLAAVSGAFGTPAAAQGRSAPGDVRGAIGGVDLQRVFNEYKGKQAAAEQIKTFGGGLDNALSRLRDSSAVFLPEAEVRELATLYSRPEPGGADKQRIGALETKARSLADELRNLQNQNGPTEQQKTRLAELTAAQQKGAETFQQVQQDFQQQLSQRQNALSQKLTEEMRAGISKVAQEKNLTVVFDSAVAVYTANDITNDVINRLNK